MQRFGSMIKKTLISTLFNKKAFLALATIAPVFAFFVLPVLGYTDPAKSNRETLYSPSANFYNSQTLALLNSKERPAPKGSVGGADEIQIEDGALIADISPITDANPDAIDLDGPKDISVYTVREGDSLGEIAEMFDISPNTIRWANDIDVKGAIKPGQELLILPISGVKHKVQKGETFATIAKKYGGDAREISLFNGIEENADLLVGTEIIIPNGEISAPTTTPNKPKTTGSSGGSKQAPTGYYGKPTLGIKTQGSHDRYGAMDIGNKTGTPIWAMADGKVLSAKPEGWNGGYGKMVIIQHDNGTQTLYAHLSKVDVVSGQSVKKGQQIGLMGSTGRSTGPHLHIEIRTGKSGLSGISILEKMY